MEQYRLIIHLCGSPDEDLMRKIEEQNSPAMRMVVERMGGNRQRANFGEFFRGVPADAVDLLDKLLVLDPDRRYERWCLWKDCIYLLESLWKKRFRTRTSGSIPCRRMSPPPIGLSTLETTTHRRALPTGNVSVSIFHLQN